MTPNREDYLKLIFELGGDEVKVNNKSNCFWTRCFGSFG